MTGAPAIVAASMLLLGTFAPQTSEAFAPSLRVSLHPSAAARHAACAISMQQQPPQPPPQREQRRESSGAWPADQISRRGLGALGMAAAVASATAASPKMAAADMLDIVTGSQKSNDFLARLKVGKVYLPTLKCNSSMPCWDRDDNFWYDFPGEEEMDGFTTTPSGLKIKDLPVNPDLAELVKTSPTPSVEEGTNNIEVVIAGYLVSPRYRTATDEALSNYYDPASKESKYYDVRNRDPRMFQFGKIALALGKSKLIKGFEEGVATMRVGMRRAIIIPPELAYGDKGSDQGTAFLKPIPPNGTLLYMVELQKIIRG